MTGQLSIPGAGPTHDPALSQYFTRPRLAARLVDWALRGAQGEPGAWRVLEPSAGAGAFVAPMLERCGHVTAQEIDPSWAAHLRESYPDARVVEGDWIDAAAPGQVYFINRPFDNAQYEYTAVRLTRHPDEVGRVFQPEWWWA